MAYLYVIPVADTIREAWEKVHGSKRVTWEAIGIAILILILCFMIQQLIQLLIPRSYGVTIVIIQIISYLLQMGLIYIGIKRAEDFPINYRLVFHCFNIIILIKLLVLALLQAIIFFIPPFLIMSSTYVFHSYTLYVFLFLLLLLVSVPLYIYLFIKMFLAIGFVMDQEKNPLEAIALSFKATRGNVWSLFLILILQTLIFILGFFTLGIGFIWILPFSLILYGTIYKKLQANLNLPAVVSAPKEPPPPSGIVNR